jgi:hypothetical protein
MYVLFVAKEEYANLAIKTITVAFMRKLAIDIATRDAIVAWFVKQQSKNKV